MELTFGVVDSAGFAMQHGRADASVYRVANLGPFVELGLLHADRLTDNMAPLAIATSASVFDGLRRPAAPGLVQELGGTAGYLHLGEVALADTEHTRLSILAKRAAAAAGFEARHAGQLSAALLEMLSNIVEHSEAPATGMVAYQGLPGTFEFVVADRGIGALASLRTNPAYAELDSDREALPLVLKDGCSRHPDAGRGKGFNDLFRGLANHHGTLRFRSGDAAVLIESGTAAAIIPKIKRKPRLTGFMASIHCRVGAPTPPML